MPTEQEQKHQEETHVAALATWSTPSCFSSLGALQKSTTAHTAQVLLWPIIQILGSPCAGE